MKATPSSTASIVTKARSLRWASPRSATFVIALRDFLHQLDHVVGCARRGVVHHEAVAQHDQAVRVGGRLRVVRDHHDRLPELVHRLAQHPQHLLARLRVEVAGGLVGEYHGRLRYQRPGHRHALLLAAGQLGRAVREAVGQPNRLHEAPQPLGVGPLAGDREREHDVLLRREDRQEVEELEDEAELVAAQPGQVAVVQLGDLDAVEDDRAARRAVESGEDVHQRRLAGPGRAHDGAVATALEIDADTGESIYRGGALAVAAADVGGGHDRIHGAQVATRGRRAWYG